MRDQVDRPNAPIILNAESENYSDEASSILRDVGVLRLEVLDREELLASLADVHALIVRLGHQVDRAVLDAAPNLRVVVSATTGLDHLDLGVLDEGGVEVLSLKGETLFLDQIYATSEHTWALLLAVLRRVPAAHAEATMGRWERDRFKGRELAGRRLGIVGFGRIGRKVADYGRAFGMSVSAFDPHPERWVEGVRRVDSLVELARSADVLTVHVPLGPETENLIDGTVIEALPPGAVVVNTSRGGVLDEAALVASLRSGHLGGAAVDVVKGEGDKATLPENPLLVHARTTDRLVVTPHIGGATFESMAKTEVFMAQKLVRFLNSS